MEILGTKYELIKNDHGLIEVNADGECQTYAKVIRIRPLQDMLYGEATEDERKKRHSEVMRHEVIHAFLMRVVLVTIRTMRNWLIGLQCSFRKCSRYFRSLVVQSK